MKTRFVLDNKVYSIEKSTVISESASFPLKEFWNFLAKEFQLFPVIGVLYRTQKGNYFMVSGDVAYKISEEQVQEFLKYNDYKKYVELFGELEEA